MARFTELRDGVGQLVRAEIERPDAAARWSGSTSWPWGRRPASGRYGTTAAHLVRVLSAEPDCVALLAVIARDTVELLTDPVARAGLRQCEGDGCRRVYLDTSRGRRRRWCSSEVCGNRERVARHRRRAACAAYGARRELTP